MKPQFGTPKSFLPLALIATLAMTVASGCGRSATSTNNGLPGGGVGVPGGGIPGGGACIPLNAPIQFTAYNAALGANDVALGIVPTNGQTFGQVQMGVAQAPGPGGLQFQRWNGAGVDGVLYMTAFPSGNTGYPPAYQGGQAPNYGQPISWMPYPGYPVQGMSRYPATIIGQLQINPLTQQDIAYQLSYLNNGSGFCVSNIAVTAYHINGAMWDIHAYLYINGTQHGYIMAP